MNQTIQIHRRGHSDEIDADVIGAWAIHETIPVSLGGWTLTHVPTGWLCLTTRYQRTAKAARAEFLASPLDWSFTDPRAITKKQQMFGRVVRRRYEGR